MNALPDSLRDLQRGAARAMIGRSDGTAVFAREGLGDGRGAAIYRHAYRARLRSALRTNFSVLHRVAGDQVFDAVAAAYIDLYPSRRPSLRWYGEHLEALLRADPDLLPHPALLDLARMDWALGSAFDAADAAPLDAGALASVDPEQWHALRFRLHPSVVLLELEWNVAPLWHADDDQASAPDAMNHTLLIWRQDLDARFRTLDAAEATVLRALREGADFGALCHVLAAGPAAAEDAPLRAARFLQGWLAQQILVGAAP